LDDERGQAYLVVVRGNNVGESYLVTGPDMVIGRGAGADLRLDDEGVSRFHCKLRQQAGGIIVEDLDSRNGTYRNGERVVAGMPVLVEGDQLRIGTTSILRFTYVVGASDSNPSSDGPVTVRDLLTGTFSRRHFIDRLEGEVSSALADKSSLALLLVHIDRYDEFSVTQGQEVVDQLTITVAGKIQSCVHSEDMLARLDGGDFALMSRATSPGDAFMLAERLRASSVGLSVPSSSRPVTLSLGIASIYDLPISTARTLLVAAGTALHRARSQGGNRAVLCTPDLLHESRHTTKV
jgi:diguanylate cyclase (GGDEF)-like protein